MTTHTNSFRSGLLQGLGLLVPALVLVAAKLVFDRAADALDERIEEGVRAMFKPFTQDEYEGHDDDEIVEGGPTGFHHPGEPT